MALVNKAELAKYLDSTGKIVTDWTVFHWYKQEGMPCIRIGRRVFFQTESVEKWLHERESGDQKEKPVEYGKLRQIN
ncbi:hypothetical protein Ga0466249_004314 [Sporomusaceae bacterium BoRhaA]|uniref:hypothetical protein n=1 Tax=Pelorhabdus rhamnosifermentans TaxID=2772457 RepID=UPI001C0645C8|nr:hypothetical protein [Pelorhabdus rhamnosifermentans]MBU2703178.1 hypothetical protein [Pelorhabdus rhamnosifermentans]